MDPATMYALSAGVGAVGGLLGSNEEHIGPGDLYPKWMRQQREDLAANITGLPGREAYGEDWVAGMNPLFQNSLQNMANFGQPGGAGYEAAQGLTSAGNQFLDAGVNQVNAMQARGPNEFEYSQDIYNQAFNNLSGGLQNQFDLGARNISRGFDWNMLPGLNMQNALGGGQGSTKFGQAGALGQAMADQNVMQFGTDLWQNAAGQADKNAMFGGQQNLASANQFDTNMLQAGQTGAGMLNQGFNMGTTGLDYGAQAGTAAQNYDQSVATADRLRWDQQQNLPWQDQENRLNQMKAFEMGSAPQNIGYSPLEGALQGAQLGLGLMDVYQQGKVPSPAGTGFSTGGINPYSQNNGFGTAPASTVNMNDYSGITQYTPLIF